MSLLRVRACLGEAPLRCAWSFLEDGRAPITGEGEFTQLPRRATRIHLLLPASEVLITRATLPPGARRHAGSVLAYALEERTAGDPDANQVIWLGNRGGADVLAVIDKARLARWLDAFEAAGLGAPEVHCETLLLPWSEGEWSLAWDGSEGIVRTGLLEGSATDRGNADTPPLALRLLLEEARERGEAPASISLHAAAGVTAGVATPDPDAWQKALGIPVRLAGPWDWRTAAAQADGRLAQRQRRWRIAPGVLARLRPAAWIVGAALAMHAAALVADWAALARSQRALREAMTAQFRATFPDAVAVVDPVLQMRRKLTEARHAAGRTDRGDFLPMFELVAAAAQDLPAGTLRVVAYEGARMSLELYGADEAGLRRMLQRLRDAGLQVERSVGASAPGARGIPGARGAGTTTIFTVRAT